MSMMNKLFVGETVKLTTSVLPQVVTADVFGAGVDVRDFASTFFVAHVGNSGDTLSTSVKIELELEESADDTTYMNVADADMEVIDVATGAASAAVVGTNTATWLLADAPTEDSLLIGARYKGSSRYVRPVVNVTGTHTNGTPIGIFACQGRPKVAS